MSRDIEPSDFQCPICGFTLYRVSIASDPISEYFQCENDKCPKYLRHISRKLLSKLAEKPDNKNPLYYF